MHTLQKLLITRLVKQNGLAYSALTKGYDSEDNVVFHLKQLLTKGFVEKRDDRYFLTLEGVTKLSTFQKTDLQDNSFKMMFFGFVCEYDGAFLIKPHKNSSEPFYNLPSGSPLFGEKLEDALSRTFYEEAGINVPFDNFKFNSLHLKTVKTNDEKILFDDAFIAYNVTITKEQKDEMELKKGSVWMEKQEIEKLDNKWPEIGMCIFKEDWKVYSVYDVTCNYIL